MLTQNVGGQTKIVKVFLKAAYWTCMTPLCKIIFSADGGFERIAVKGCQNKETRTTINRVAACLSFKASPDAQSFKSVVSLKTKLKTFLFSKCFY